MKCLKKRTDVGMFGESIQISTEVKFVYFGKATEFCEISTVDLSYVVMVKFMGEFSQNFLAFSEYMNFTNYKSRSIYKTITIIYFPDDNKEYWIFNLTRSSFDFVQVSFFLYC